MTSLYKAGVAGLVVALAIGSFWSGLVQAEQTSQSSNYQATGLEFDPFASNPGCADGLCSEVSLGSGLRAPADALPVQLGDLEQSEPQLDIVIEHGSTELGELSVDEVSTKTVDVTVRGYQSGGYMLYLIGQPPRIGKHTLQAIDGTSRSRPGHEQFGVNLVANNSPALGSTVVSELEDAAPQISPNYSQTNQFSYHDGAMIASSVSDSSRDTYTVSMIINVSSATPPGEYQGGFGILAVPGF